MCFKLMFFKFNIYVSVSVAKIKELPLELPFMVPLVLLLSEMIVQGYVPSKIIFR